jgi:RimJ/RimL family protein N-acetyltransferase
MNATTDRIDLQPTLEGALLRLRPMRPDDFEPLYAAASDPLIWEQHPAHDRWQRDVFRGYFDAGIACGGALVAVDRTSGALVGSSRYYGWNPAVREVEIGWTFLARSHWGGRYNAEMKALMLAHAFTFAHTVLFLVGPKNLRSRRAVEKIGGVLRGTVERFGSESVVYALTRTTCRQELPDYGLDTRRMRPLP